MKPIARARQSLQGLAVGDAFGESLLRKSAAPPWPWTDDTAMALSIVEILAAHDGIDPDALAAAFARRLVAEPERGYGQGAFNLLVRISYGAPWRAEAARLFGGTGSFGNGAAMRAAPIGAYFAGDFERVRAEALRSAEPTHAHPDGAAGAVAVAIAAAAAATGEELLAAAIRFTPPSKTLEGLRAAAAMPLDAEPAAAAAKLGTGLAVAAHDTVPFALWAAARHLASYEAAIRTATGEPGDRDTVGAIVGGIVVLADAAIPRAWLAATEPLP